MCALTELGLITKPALCEMISECACFLVHPNLWIRHAVVGFITITTKVLPVLDVQCKIMPNLIDYMKYPLIQIDKYEIDIDFFIIYSLKNIFCFRPELLFDSLQNPIVRYVYDSVVLYPDLELLLKMFKQRRLARLEASEGRVTTLGGWDPAINAVSMLTKESIKLV